MENFMGKLMAGSIAAVTLNQGIAALFDYNPIQSLIPQYAKWIFVGVGALGAFILYGIFSKR